MKSIETNLIEIFVKRLQILRYRTTTIHTYKSLIVVFLTFEGVLNLRLPNWYLSFTNRLPL